MKLEVEMYVRTLNGIVKIDKIRNGIMKDKKGHLHFGDFIKASHNIIDLIEVGDYVNGLKVYEVRNDIKGFGVVVFSDCSIHEWQINSIVTKEMFSNAEYRVETN